MAMIGSCVFVRVKLTRPNWADGLVEMYAPHPLETDGVHRDVKAWHGMAKQLTRHHE